VLAGIAILVVLYVFAEHIPRTISIFLIAAFIAFGVNPVCRFLVQRRVPKALAITIVFLALSIVIVVGLLVIVPLTIAQLQVLGTNAPAFVESIQVWSQDAETWLQSHVPGLIIPQNAFDIGQLGGQRLTALATGSLTSLGAILIGTATAFFVAFSSIVLSFFFLLNDQQIVSAFVSLFPVKRRATARKLATEVT
jgi:putative heme transporter